MVFFMASDEVISGRVAPILMFCLSLTIEWESTIKGTRYVFTALHRDEADFEQNKTSGWKEGTEIAMDQFVALVTSLK
jgi:hypothetical protein